MNFQKKLGVAVVVAAALFCTHSSAEAGFQATFRAGAAEKTVVDGGVGDADGIVNNEINVSSLVVGSYTFTSTLQTTNTPGGGTISFVESGTNRIQGTGATTVEVVASANGFTSPTSPPPLEANSGMTGQFLSATTPGNQGTFSYNAYYDTTNTLATNDAGTGIGNGTSAIITHPSPGNNASNDTEIFSNSTTPFTLTLVLRAQFHTATGTNSVDLDGTLSVQPIPAPAGLILALSGMPVLGLGAWLRRRRTAA